MELHKQATRTDQEIQDELKDEYVRAIKAVRMMRQRVQHINALMDVARDTDAPQEEIDQLQQKRNQYLNQVIDLEFKQEDIHLQLVAFAKASRS